MTQARILDAVARRGYLNGYSVDQLIARQAVKGTEEWAEVVDCVRPRFSGHDADLWFEMAACVQRAGELARRLFDGADWQNVELQLLYDLPGELYDMAVVLNVAAGLAGVDLQEGALEKATKDIKRGVR